MGRAKLTALAVERAHRTAVPVLLSDGDGLYLRKQTRDGASWTLRYHFAGRNHWMTLGGYADVSLPQARIDAQGGARTDRPAPKPSRAAPRGARQRAPKRRVQDALRGLIRSEIQGQRTKIPGRSKALSRQILVAKTWAISACEITAGDVARLLDDLKVRAPTSANDLLRFTRRIFAFGVRRGLVMSNPVADFSPRLDGGGTEKPRSRALSADELAQLFKRSGRSKLRGEQSAGHPPASCLVRAQDDCLPPAGRSSILK